MFGGARELGNLVGKVVGGIHIEFPHRRVEIIVGRLVKYLIRAVGQMACVILTQDYAVTSGGYLEGGLTRGLGSWVAGKLLGVRFGEDS